MATNNRTFRGAGSMFVGTAAVFTCLVVSAAWADNGPELLSESELIRGRQGTEPTKYTCVASCATVAKNECSIPLSPPVFCANNGSNAGRACGYHVDQISPSKLCQESPTGTLDTCTTDKATKCYRVAWCYCKKKMDGTYGCTYTGETHMWSFPANCASTDCIPGQPDQIFCIYAQ